MMFETFFGQALQQIPSCLPLFVMISVVIFAIGMIIEM